MVGMSVGAPPVPSADNVSTAAAATVEARFSRAKLEGVEAGRGVAATLVVLYHSALHVEGNVGGTLLWGLPHFGHAGVDFFFVLSGFIISFVHRGDIDRPGRLGRYAQRRFTRVLPFYWLVLGYSLLVLGVFHRTRFPRLWEVISNTLLLPQNQDQIVGGAWTLVFELLFYVMFATLIFSRRVGAVLFAAWGALIVAGLALHPLPTTVPLVAVLASPFSLEFFLGMGCAYFLARCTLPATRLLLVAGLAAFAASAYLEVAGVLYGFGALARVAYGSASVLIILALVERERSGLLRVPKVMGAIGRASYAVYLVHLVAIGLTYKTVALLMHPRPSWSLLLWMLLCVLGVCGGVLASIAVEQPVIRYCRQHLFGARA
jgi:exopolysaccharide production protein ExoZ